MIVGAILTQNTAWTNVERALGQLRAARVLTLEGIRQTTQAALEKLIRPAGFFRQKASRLKAFIAHLDRVHEGSLDRMFAQPTSTLRQELLNLNGIGPETADSILLYSAQHEIFVVDAYTRRIFGRHGILPESTGYEEIRLLIERALTPEFARSTLRNSHAIEASILTKPPGAHHPPSTMSTAARSEVAQIYNEAHGLLVGVGKNYCQSRRVLCEQCPLRRLLPAPVSVPNRDRKRPRIR